jgi:hypothetical protein
MTGEDFTKGVEGLKVGNKETTLSAHKRHKPFQGNVVNRDEFEQGTYGEIRVGEGHDTLFSSHFDREPSGRKLVVSPEAYEHEGSTWLRLRENGTGKLVAMAGHWLKVRDETDCSVQDTLLKAEKYVCMPWR